MPIAIERHILELLYRHDCVIIPNLGGLVANYTPAMVGEDQKGLVPPHKGFIWNKFLQHNDGLLANELVKIHGLSYDDAVNEILHFVSNVKIALKEHKRFEFDTIGYLYADPTGQIGLEYAGKNFLMNSFGLPVVRLEKLPQLSLVHEVIEKAEEIQPTEEKETKVIPITKTEVVEKVVTRGSKWWIAAALIPIGFYSAWIPMKTDLLSGGDNFHYSDLNPFTYSKSKGNYKMVSNHLLIVDTLPSVSFEPLELFQPDTEEIMNEENTVLSAESTFVDVDKPEVEKLPVNATVGHYFVIGGCFSDEANALNFVDQLKEQGFNAVLVDVNKGLHRVAFGQYANKEEAKNVQEEILAQGQHKAWVLKK